MYDYEFESIAVDSDEAEGEEGEEVYGYLILELIREGGDLIFLKRIKQTDKPIDNNVSVVDKSGAEVKLGAHYGWIDCLLIAKDMVAKSTEGTNSTTTKKPEPKKKKETPKITRPKSNGSAKSFNGINNGGEKKPKSFAYAAAAAAHKY